jgi:16S rRNA (cytidine1402-2'-O)-methyltransferase
VRRGSLADLAAWAADGVKGEITVVVHGAPARSGDVDAGSLARQVSELEAAGWSRKEAIAEVVRTTGAHRREVFDAVVAAKRPN